MGAHDILNLISYSKGCIVSKVIHKGESDVTLFCMARGTELSEHTSTREAMIYVIEGKGTFVLEGKSVKMLPGVLIFMKKSAAHSLKAEQNMSFLLSLY